MTTDHLDILPRRLREAREALRLSRIALAVKAEISERTVVNYETGKTPPDADALLKFSELLERPVGWFFGEEAANDGPISAEAAARKYGVGNLVPGPAALVVTLRSGSQTATHELRWFYGPPVVVDVDAKT